MNLNHGHHCIVNLPNRVSIPIRDLMNLNLESGSSGKNMSPVSIPIRDLMNLNRVDSSHLYNASVRFNPY